MFHWQPNVRFLSKPKHFHSNSIQLKTVAYENESEEPILLLWQNNGNSKKWKYIFDKSSICLISFCRGITTGTHHPGIEDDRYDPFPQYLYYSVLYSELKYIINIILVDTWNKPTIDCMIDIHPFIEMFNLQSSPVWTKKSTLCTSFCQIGESIGVRVWLSQVVSDGLAADYAELLLVGWVYVITRWTGATC